MILKVNTTYGGLMVDTEKAIETLGVDLVNELTLAIYNGKITRDQMIAALMVLGVTPLTDEC